jgi:ATP-dependent RNA helicase RhlE
MLDMGFLPDVRRILAKLPARRQTMLFSATMPPPIVELSRVMLREPVALNIKRRSAPAKGITHQVYPVPGPLKSELLVELLSRTAYDSVLAFTRTKHRANRLAELLERRGVACARIHGNRSQTRRTEALSGFKSGKFRVLVATDIAARGIDVEALALVVNFDVPHVPEDYIHRVGRTARVDATGVAITLVAPDEEADLAAIERYLGARVPRQRLAGFDYNRRTTERFEIPIGERIAEIRKRKAEERARTKAKAERKAAATSATPPVPRDRPAVQDPRRSTERPGSTGAAPRSRRRRRWRGYAGSRSHGPQRG